MKKRFLSVISTVVALVLSVAVMSGCNLITKNSDREMNTVVATVNVNTEEHVYKKDMVMAYLSYGYYYVNYQGLSAAQTLELILDNLINNIILVQNAMQEAEDNSLIEDSSKAKYTVERYLSADSLIEAEYNAYKSMNDMLDGYEDDGEGDVKGDTLTLTVRTVPTGATNATEELTKEDKIEYVKKGIDTDGTESRRDAMNNVVKSLQNNGLLGSEYDGKDLTKTEYYKNLYKSYCENELLEAYEKRIAAEARKITFSELETEFTAKINTQKAWSNEEFVTALGDAKASDPILYSAYGSYGYVYNLLLGVNDYQSSEISKIKTDDPDITDSEYDDARNEILEKITVKDQRASWILSGYDFDFTTKKFTGDYTFAKIKENENDVASKNSLPFQGEVKELKAKTDDESGEYSVTSVKTFGLEEFISFMDKYVYGEEKTGETATEKWIKKKISVDSDVEEYSEKINELLFAFSTDSGSLNTWKGYAVKPAVDGSDSEEYVQTFADGARQLLETGGKSYIIVATDYGYHVMFYSELIGNDFGYDNLTSYLDSLSIQDKGENWTDYLDKMLNDWDDFEDTDNFLYTFVDSLTSAKVTAAKNEAETKVINKYRYDSKDYVTVYKNSYADLLG